jgi:hypothetical protein
MTSTPDTKYVRMPPAAPTRAPASPPLYARVLVVFCGSAGVAWLRWLRPGFRHCFAAVDDGSAWITVDPLLHRLEVQATGLASTFDLAGEYRRMGLTVIDWTPRAVPLTRAPLGVFTCVETVKRLLGIRARRVVTPWQLYRWLASRCGGARGRGWWKPLLGTKEENMLDEAAEE